MKSSTCIHYSLRTAYKYIVIITFGVCSVMNKTTSLVPRPSHHPVFDRLQSEFIGASLSEPHILQLGDFIYLCIEVWYDRHPRAALGRTKYVGLP